MGELLYHWTNPKFDGLPWPADRKKPVCKGSGSKARDRRCCKMNRSEMDARKEAAGLNREAPNANWIYDYCQACKGWHVLRH